MEEVMRESCGVFGIVKKSKEEKTFTFHKGMGTVDQVFSKTTLKKLGELGDRVALGLKELQHRGQESAGIAISQNAGLGHNRYSTTGESNIFNIQPIVGNFRGEPFALAHNGNIKNIETLKRKAEERGFDFTKLKMDQGLDEKVELSDTWLIISLIETSSQSNFLEAVSETLPLLEGAFSLIFLYQDSIIGIRDRFGIRPLCLGESNEYFILASESCALESLGAKLVRDLNPGADYLGYLSLENTLKAIIESGIRKKLQPCNFCSACFTGKYPI